MNTDVILDFIVEYYIWFIVGFGIIVLAIIGFVADKKKLLPTKNNHKNVEKENIIEEKQDMQTPENIIKNSEQSDYVSEIGENSNYIYTNNSTETNQLETNHLEIENVGSDHVVTEEESIKPIAEASLVTNNDIQSNQIGTETDKLEEPFNNIWTSIDDSNKNINEDEENMENKETNSLINNSSKNGANEINHGETINNKIFSSNPDELNYSKQQLKNEGDIVTETETIDNGITSEIEDFDGSSKTNNQNLNKDSFITEPVNKTLYDDIDKINNMPFDQDEKEKDLLKNISDSVNIEFAEDSDSKNFGSNNTILNSNKDEIGEIYNHQDNEKVGAFVGENDDIIKDEKEVNNMQNLDDTMQISYSKLKEMVEDIIAENEKENNLKIEEKGNEAIQSNEGSFSEIKDDGTMHNNILQQDIDDDDVWKF